MISGRKTDAAAASTTASRADESSASADDAEPDEEVPHIPTSTTSRAEAAGGTKRGGVWSAVKTLVLLLLIALLIGTGYQYRWNEWVGQQINSFGEYMTKHVRVVGPAVEETTPPAQFNVRFASDQRKIGGVQTFNLFKHSQAYYLPPRGHEDETRYVCAEAILTDEQADYNVSDHLEWSMQNLSLTTAFRNHLDENEAVKVQLVRRSFPGGECWPSN